MEKIGIKVIALITLFFILPGCSASTSRPGGIKESHISIPKIQDDETIEGGVGRKELIPPEKEELVTGSPLQYTDVFTDPNDGMVYFFDKTTGNYSGFIKPDKLSEVSVTPDHHPGEEERRQISNDFLSKLLDLSKYTELENMHNEYGDVYYFNYAKFMGGYRTTDHLMVSVFPNGTISAFRAENTGLFDNLKIPEIAPERLITLFEEEKSRVYPIPLDEYEITDKILGYEDGKFVMEIYFVATILGSSEEESYKAGYTVKVIIQ